jgi:hypothetical protein
MQINKGYVLLGVLVLFCLIMIATGKDFMYVRGNNLAKAPMPADGGDKRGKGNLMYIFGDLGGPGPSCCSGWAGNAGSPSSGP